jgi:hypothetical protein
MRHPLVHMVAMIGTKHERRLGRKQFDTNFVDGAETNPLAPALTWCTGVASPDAGRTSPGTGVLSAKRLSRGFCFSAIANEGERAMHRVTLLLVVATVAVASAASVGSVSAVPIDGAAIAKAVSANQLVREVYWRHWGWGYRGWGYRRGPCLNSPAHC